MQSMTLLPNDKHVLRQIQSLDMLLGGWRNSSLRLLPIVSKNVQDCFLYFIKKLTHWGNVILIIKCYASIVMVKFKKKNP